MATNVCICDANLQVDGDGRLCVKHDCSLVDGADGLSLPVMQVYQVYAGHEPATQDVSSDPSVGTVLTPTVHGTITNSSTCRNMLVEIIQDDMVAMGIGDNDKVYMYQRYSDNGGSYLLAAVEQFPPLDSGSGQRAVEGNRHQVHRFVVLAPGATYTVDLNIFVKVLVNGTGDPTQCYDNSLTLHMHGSLI